ncbi:LapA family protein [Marinicellulosiphila megalodicopiae]|uniref:LapA family protein n=1 Tax=Marinicellulosiphila megalodicopiae TaxID=2724896 RepID=UPI003BAE9BFA
MIKLFKLLKFWLILLCFTAIGIAIGFSSENTQPINLSFLDFKSPEAPLFVWLLIAFIFGVTLTLIVLSPLFLRKKRTPPKK